MPLPIGNYTFYSNFQNCPHKAWHMYVLKDLPHTPKSKEQNWGNDVHSAMEKRVRDGVPLPELMAPAEGIAKVIHELREPAEVDAELYIGMTQQGQPCPSRSDDCWFRGKIDVAVRLAPNAWIVDWKTGKVREEPFELETNALLLKINWPELTNIVANYFWMQSGTHGLRYHCNDHSRTFGTLQSIRAEMDHYELQGHGWPKRKNPLCGWCPVKSCEHNTNKEG
jgi:hypothetical protein